MTSVDHLYIQTEKSLVNCVHYFPNATKLTFEADIPISYVATLPNLSRVICSEKITKLIVEYKNLYFNKLMDLLSILPNIHTLIFGSMLLLKSEVIMIHKSKPFRLLSERNRITNVTLEDMCSLGNVKLFVTLFPWLQNLTTYVLMKDMERILQYLLERTNPHTGRLVSLCFLKADSHTFNYLNTLIKSQKLPRRCMLKYIDSKLYLWW
jgi:hypothetical protein